MLFLYPIRFGHVDRRPEASLCQSLQVLYSHLSVIAFSDSVKLVIVLKLKQDAAAAAFHSFFSWFTLKCLTIPFWDSPSRHYVFRALTLSPHYDCHPCLAVHPSGLILESGSHFLQYYGARSFPFTRIHREDITRYDNSIRHAICSNHNIVILQELLQCGRLSQIANVDNNLLDIPLGLYLYCDGSFMDDLRKLHKSCLDKGLKFDAVVPLPFVEHYDPVSFCNRMKQCALKDEISSSWWLFPFNDDICRTLGRVACTYNTYTDKFIILPHGDRLLGKDFTNMWDLHNKNVLLYLDNSSFDTSSLYKQLTERYCKIKRQFCDCEVVLVSVKPRFSNADAEIDWPILPAEKCEAVIKHIFTNQLVAFVGSTLCAFGKDGKLLSRWAWECLSIRKSSNPLFRDTLYTEILEDVKEKLERYI